MCRSIGRPASAASSRSVLAWRHRGQASRCGQPPTTSAPAAMASRSRARWSAPAAPVTGQRRQRHDLDVDQVAVAAPGLAPSASTRADADVGGHVDVGADRRHAVGDQHAGRPLGPLGDVVDGQRVAGCACHGLDGAERGRPCGLTMRSAVKRLVEVGVGLGRSRQHAGSRRGRRPSRPPRLTRRPTADGAVDDGDVGRSAVGESGPSGTRCRSRRRTSGQGEQVGSGRRSTGSPRRGKTSSTTRCICSSMSSVARPG